MMTLREGRVVEEYVGRVFRMCSVYRLKEKQAKRQQGTEQDVQTGGTSADEEEMDTGYDLSVCIIIIISSIYLSDCLSGVSSSAGSADLINLPDFFAGCRFFVYGDQLTAQNQQLLKRYIVAYAG